MDAQVPTVARAKHLHLANSRADKAAKNSLYSLSKMGNTAAQRQLELDALERQAKQPFLQSICQYLLVLAQN